MTRERLISLDVFRGFTILLMTIVNNPGSWSSIYPPLEHANWNGCTPTDLVFPFFIFILGVAIPFAMPNKTFDSATLTKITVRSLRIFCLGLFLYFFGQIKLFGLEGVSLIIIRLAITFAVAYALLGNFSLKIKKTLVLFILGVMLFLAYGGIETFKDVRIPGVLQRIAIVYFAVSILYLKTTQKKQILIATALLLGYWAIMTLIPVPGIGAANLEKGTNLAAWVDSILLKGHMWKTTNTWDPEGVLSTIPAIVSGIIGLLIGQLLNSGLLKYEIIKKMLAYGSLLVILGLAWNIFFPLNKSLWTSSFVVYTSGLAILCFCVLYYIIDVAEKRKWTQLFLFWGVNPMIVFFFSGIIPRILSMIQFQNPNIPAEQISLQNYLYSFWITPYFDNPMTASLVWALYYVVFWSLILWFFYQKKLIFKV